MKNSRLLLWTTIVIIIVGVLVAIRYANKGGVKRSSTQAPVLGTARLNQKAPEFQTATTQGVFNLADVHEPVFLEIFATWCPHCQRETAVIDQLYAKYKGKVRFIAVTGSHVGMDHNSPESERDTINFVQLFHVQYPVAFDGSLEIAKKYLQSGYPTLVVINRKKIITYLTSGETRFPELDAAVKHALSS